MKRNSIYGALLLSASLFSGSAFADTKMTVVTRDGAEDEISVTENGFIFFKDNFMNVVAKADDSKTVTYDLSLIQKVLFGDSQSAVKVLGEGEMVLYPTVATTQVFLANAADNLNEVSIVDAAGRQVATVSLSAGNAINISGLVPGVYILKAGNANFKFQKR